MINSFFSAAIAKMAAKTKTALPLFLSPRVFCGTVLAAAALLSAVILMPRVQAAYADYMSPPVVHAEAVIQQTQDTQPHSALTPPKIPQAADDTKKLNLEELARIKNSRAVKPSSENAEESDASAVSLSMAQPQTRQVSRMNFNLSALRPY